MKMQNLNEKELKEEYILYFLPFDEKMFLFDEKYILFAFNFLFSISI